MLTDNGKNLLLRYLANVSPGFVRELAVGIGNGSPVSSDSRLDFEIARVTIVTGSINGSTTEVIYHGSLDSDDSYIINEIGLFPVSTSTAGLSGNGQLLSSFEAGDGTVFINPVTIPGGQEESSYIEKSSTVVPQASNLRLGAAASYLCSQGELSFPSLGDFSQFGPNDELNFAFITPVNSFDFTVTLFDTNNNSMSINLSDSGITNGKFTTANGRGVVNSGTGYNYVIYSQKIGTQTIDFSNLSQIEIVNNNSSFIIFDGARFEEVDTVNPLNSMVARQTLTSAQEKLNGFSMDIEYRLTVGFNG
jgi:hypothetical protein